MFKVVDFAFRGAGRLDVLVKPHKNGCLLSDLRAAWPDCQGLAGGAVVAFPNGKRIKPRDPNGHASIQDVDQQNQAANNTV